ncbi:MAG TPA: hydroxymethylpyrimidine/phosphomethylpyrimidine kinase [Solimonas sp.]
MTPSRVRPQVLCISGHDPSGGAGLQADIEAVAAQHAHALVAVTCLTVQNTRDVSRVVPTAPSLLAQQLEAVLDDCPVHAIKIGLVGDAAQVPAIVAAIERAAVPIVLDPVLRAGGGANLAAAATALALLTELLPRATIATPNAAEARRLAPGAEDLDACGAALLARGCPNLLITGGDEPSAQVYNHWYAAGAAPRRFEYARVPSGFHGAGCTLASALAARLARGEDLATALVNAQDYVAESLARGLQIGGGRPIPGRFA